MRIVSVVFVCLSVGCAGDSPPPVAAAPKPAPLRRFLPPRPDRPDRPDAVPIDESVVAAWEAAGAERSGESAVTVTAAAISRGGRLPNIETPFHLIVGEGADLSRLAQLTDLSNASSVFFVPGAKQSESIPVLAKLPLLDWLRLGSELSDADAAALSGCAKLAELDARLGRLKASAVPHLAKMKRLRVLMLSPAFGDSAQELRRLLPECTVFAGRPVPPTSPEADPSRPM